MIRRVHFAVQADVDVGNAVQWYEDQRPGLGIEFLLQLDSLMDRIRRTPQQFPIAKGDVRRALLRRFPFAIYFISADETVEVVAVLHQHRHPEEWERRRQE